MLVIFSTLDCEMVHFVLGFSILGDCTHLFLSFWQYCTNKIQPQGLIAVTLFQTETHALVVKCPERDVAKIQEKHDNPLGKEN